MNSDLEVKKGANITGIKVKKSNYNLLLATSKNNLHPNNSSVAIWRLHNYNFS